MNTAEIVTQVLRRPEEEKDRPGFPTGFPDPIDIPARRYCDPAFHELEMQHVFSRAWLFVAHAGQLPEPGDYLRLDNLPAPLFLIRDNDDQIRCFYNACQHRGAPLIQDASGNKATLVCPFHAWTYDRQGQLRGFPEAKNFPRNADKSCLGLKEVRCESYGALVFVNLDNEAVPLRDYLGPVAEELDTLVGDQAADTHYFRTEIMEVDANWKFSVDANVETYHVPFLHKDTAHAAIDTPRTGQWLLPNGHSRMMIRYRPELEEQLGKQASALAFAGLRDNPLPTHGVYSFHLFPNTSIVMSGAELFFLITMAPGSHERHKYIVTYLTAVAETADNAKYLGRLADFNTQVLKEDLSVIPDMQKAAASGGIEQFKLQFQERRIRRLHEDLDNWIGAERIPAALRVPTLLNDYVEAR